MQSEKYNVLVIGQTGVGKSSFINYLFGKDICQAGTGKPVTGRGLHETEFRINNLNVSLYDSWGLEADKYEEWMKKFEEELEKRSFNKPASEWFHSVFYLIGAGGHRVQEADFEIIRKLQKEKYCVNVVLNKCDMLSEEQESLMKEAIKKEVNVPIVIPICSGGKNRSGKIEPFGKEEIEKAMLQNFFDSIAIRLPEYAKVKIKDFMEELEFYIKEEIEKIGAFEQESKVRGLKMDIEKRFSNFTKYLETDIRDTIIKYGKVISNFYEQSSLSNERYRFFINEISITGWWDNIANFFKNVVNSIFGSHRDEIKKVFNEFLKEKEFFFKQWIALLEQELSNLKEKNRELVLLTL